MISDETENSLVVVHGVGGTEIDDDSRVGFGLDHALGLRKAENVAGLVEELEPGGQVGLVVDGEHARDHLSQSHFLKIYGCSR